MVLRAQWPLGTIAQFFQFVAEEKKKKKKKDDKKTKAFYDWATTGIPVKKDNKTKAFYDWATTGIPVKSTRPSSKTTVCEPTDFLFLLFCVLSVYSNLLLPTTHTTTQPLQWKTKSDSYVLCLW